MSGKLFDMSQSDFKEFVADRFITRSEMEKFATKEELYKVAKETSEHSTKIIKSAVSDAVKETLISVGIDPTEPVKMQETMSAIRSLVEDKKSDMKTIRITIIKWASIGVITMCYSSAVIYLAKTLKIIK